MNFIPGKKYVDRINNVYTYIMNFSGESFYPHLFQCEKGKARFRSNDGGLFSNTPNDKDIVAEYVEPTCVWFWINDDSARYVLDFKIQKYFYQTKEKLINSTPKTLRERKDFKILKVNLKTGETCLDM